MVINGSLQKQDIYTFLPVVLAIISFELYWFTAQSAKVKAIFYKKNEFDKASANHITFLRVFGFLTMGLMTAAVCLIFMPDYSLKDYGLTFNSETRLFSLLWTIGLMLLIIPVASLSARKPKNLINYPQIRARVWNRKIVFMNIAGWLIYLFGYEFLFRGILLFPLANYLGVWTAVAINTALYSATHIPKGLEETVGAFILGTVLCLLTLISGTIWIAFFVHVALAMTNSFTALKFHPDIKYMK